MTDRKTRSLTALRPTLLDPVQSSPVTWLRGEIDRLFDDFGGSAKSLFDFAGKGGNDLQPALELADEGKRYHLSLELPGMSEEDIDVEYADGLLTISGEKREREERKGKGYLMSERRYGSFSRQISLPGDANSEAISAKFDKGVLSVFVGKDENAANKPRKIAIGK